jgi:hypothetical protein
MEKTRHYEFEGIILEIPLCYDALSGMYLEVYPDFIEDPVRTPEGCPVLFAGEDACHYAESADGGSCPDCGSCRFFRPAAPHTWIGVCGHEKQRCPPKSTPAGDSGEGTGDPPEKGQSQTGIGSPKD